MKISALNAYGVVTTVKARCTMKSDMRPFKNGNGKLFSCVLVDEDGDIKATAFNEDADRLYELLKENQVYLVSRFRVKPADQRYNKTTHSYEITFGKDTSVQLVEDGIKDIPSAKFNFIEDLSALTLKNDKEYVDICAAVLDVGDTSTITQKTTGQELIKRDISLCDASMMQVKLTIWNDQATLFEAHPTGITILSMKNVRISEFNGRSLSTGGNSVVVQNDFTNLHAKQLYEWFKIHKDEQFTPFNKDNLDGRSVKRVKREDFMWIQPALKMPVEDKGYWFTIVAIIKNVVGRSLYYASCATCKKKVNQIGDQWKCEKCDVEMEEPMYRYVVSMDIADTTGEAQVQLFDQEATAVFGMTANKMHELVKEMDESTKDNMVKQMMNQRHFMMKIVLKMEEYNGDLKKRMTCKSIENVDYVSYSNKLVQLLDSFE